MVLKAPRHVGMSKDMESASEIIQGICPDITCQAIRDSVKLGSYTEGRKRPLLAKLDHSCDVLSILASWQQLLQSKTPRVFIKPHQSPHERYTEATLLHQRKLLIESGTDKKERFLSTLLLNTECMLISWHNVCLIITYVMVYSESNCFLLTSYFQYFRLQCQF